MLPASALRFVFDERGDFTENRCNLEAVDLEPLSEPEDVQLVLDLVRRHLEFTDSPRAKWILENRNEALMRFIKVFPHEYKRVLGVPRVAQAYIPGESVAVLANAEQVQHG